MCVYICIYIVGFFTTIIIYTASYKLNGTATMVYNYYIALYLP